MTHPESLPPFDDAAQDLARTARHSGIELDANAAAQWLVAMSGGDRVALEQDAHNGVIASHAALLDFDPGDLAYFRRLAERVRVIRHPQVDSAIAIAGSAAQGRVQLFPGDNDFFERVHIRAADAQAARAVLREVMRATALRAFSEPDIVLVEVNFGVYPFEAMERGSKRAAGDVITWTPQDVVNGYIEITDARDNSAKRIAWDETAAGLGWTYLGWIVADRAEGRIALASNMLDVTWQTPGGEIESLDGAIDSFFQEVYLDPAALPLLGLLRRHTDPHALQSFTNAMRSQVVHYSREAPNYGKVCKRLYNLFRLTDQLEAAAYVREIFDEPPAQLYQVPGLLEAADIALRDPSAEIDRATVLKQIELVTRQVRDATEGKDEARIVAALKRLQQEVLSETPGANWDEILQTVREHCAAIVNEFFRAKLFAFPPIENFVLELGENRIAS